MGNIAHNKMNSGSDLYIRQRYFVLHAPLLEAPWDEFQPSWSYWKNVLINIAGFIPLGFFFCAYFSSIRGLDRAVLATIVFGGVVSLTIEVLQAFLPTRDSGMTDLITNTLGTGIGAVLYTCGSVRILFAKVGLPDFVNWFANRNCPAREVVAAAEGWSLWLRFCPPAEAVSDSTCHLLPI